MDNKTDFNDLVRSVDNNKILLPDFQRDFVWKDEEQQKSITASVLAKMPIGSVLLLESQPSEYACKRIGCNQEIHTEEIDGKIHFLLDGQQRITVLTNVFSNVIQENTKTVSDLISPSLKRRFFLKVPKWSSAYMRTNKDDDLFGVKYLEFPLDNPDTDIPDFLSGDVLSCIECMTFRKNDDKPYNPSKKLSTDIDVFCLSQDNCYLIPLFLAVAAGRNQKLIQLRYNTIIDEISKSISNEIHNYYTSLAGNNDARRGFVVDFFRGNDVENILSDDEVFELELSNRAQIWANDVRKYINSCLKEMVLNRIVVTEQERKRAIDIYENMNRGGVSLNTFDLIMAKVAIVSKVRFMDRVISAIMGEKDEYPTGVLPDEIDKVMIPLIKAKKYNASKNTECYNESKKEIATQYIDVFLDVLSFYCNNKDYDATKFNVAQIKKNAILALTPQEINDNTEHICKSIDRALFFLQSRCGIRKIREINNSLILVIIATVFTNDEWFKSKKVHELLEAWYWSALFSGEFDKDQNAALIRNLQNIIKTLKGNADSHWIHSMKDAVLKQPNFSDKDLLLMKKVSEDRYPKQILRAAICQFFLSRPYTDMFDEQKLISVFCLEANELEAHHIIPLGSTTTYGQSSQLLRKDPGNICNSPLNFVYITKSANNAISDDALDVYIKKITNAAKASLHISGYTANGSPDSILDARFDTVQGDIVNRITKLLS